MSQTTGDQVTPLTSQPSADEISALEKLEAAQRLAEQCSALDDAELDTNGASAKAWRDALGLWLQWNQAHEQITRALFDNGKPDQQLEDVMDHLDRMRKKAVELSEGLIGLN